MLDSLFRGFLENFIADRILEQFRDSGQVSSAGSSFELVPKVRDYVQKLTYDMKPKLGNGTNLGKGTNFGIGTLRGANHE